MKLYGIALLLWSLFVLAESIAGGMVGYSGIEYFASIFVLTAIVICPAVATYTKCGLNSDSSIFVTNDEMTSQHRIMQKKFKHWKLIQYVIIASVAI